MNREAVALEPRALVPSARRDRLRALLHHRFAPCITHASTIALVGAMYALLLLAPFWIALVPCLLLHHRIMVLTHEYIHGIPFHRHRHNLYVLAAMEPLLLTAGIIELFRGTHLAHHRWLNTARDPAFQSARRAPSERRSWLHGLSQLEGVQHFHYLAEAIRGRHPIVRPRRMLLGLVLTLGAIAFWIAVGHAEVLLYLAIVGTWSGMVSSSLRGAAEHHGRPGELHSTNEYRSFIPLFNLNRHVHHHEDPSCPWYLLEFRSPTLPARSFVTHWVHVYLVRDYVLLPPPPPHARD